MGSCCSTSAKGRNRNPSSSPSTGSRRRVKKEVEKKGGSIWSYVVDSNTLVVGEDELHRIPGRMFLNGASDVSCLFTQQGRKGTNQDAMIVWENFGSRNDTIFCGIFDGHGPFGHMVAKKVRDSLPLKLFTHWKSSDGSLNNSAAGSMNSEETASINMDDEWGESLDLDENEKLPEMFLTLRHSLLKAFKAMDKDLKMQPAIDCFCSGSTAVTLVKQGQDIVIANVGDSRAILGTRDQNGALLAVQLTVDLKPNLPREAARIQQCRGRVFALQDEPEVPRVWLPNNDSPGLAMARAFGDFCLKDFGLISVPDISYRRLTERDEFIVLATDGVWDVLSNKEVVDIVACAPTRATAARAVVDSAVRAWRLKFPTSKSDDCAVVCLFLGDPASYDQPRGNALEKPLSKEATEVKISGSEDIKSDLKTHELVGAWVRSSQFDSSEIVRGLDEIVPVSDSKDEKQADRSQSKRSLAECISVADDEEWSALEGVTRVNTLLNLPRFLSGDRRGTSWRKWL